MTKRPDSHQIGDLAVAAVRRIWIETGAAVEEQQTDYGEDLLVLPSFSNTVDPSRIWVQVKGTGNIDRFRTASGALHDMLPLHNLIRWAQSAEPVVLILWDVTSDKGWYANPAEQVDLDDLYMSQQSSATIRFGNDHIFTVEVARLISWHTSLKHIDNCIRLSLLRYELDSDEVARRLHRRATSMVFDLSRKLDLYDDNGIKESIRSDVARLVQNWRSDPEFPDDDDQLLNMACGLVFRGH